MRTPERAVASSPSTLVDIARLLSAAQGVIWFALLSFGGQGLVFGPMAWIATVAGSRFPPLAILLLTVPVVWLSTSWAPILGERARLIDWIIFGALTGPAVVAGAIFLWRLFISLGHAVHRRTSGHPI